MPARTHVSIAALLFVVTAIVACGGTTDGTTPIVANDSGDPGDQTPDASADTDADPSRSTDAAAETGDHADATTPPAPDAAVPDASPIDPTDGTPHPQACTSGYGAALSKTYGRLDGFLDAKQCGTVDTHLRIQVRMGGNAYDCAINLDTLYVMKDAPMPGAAWSEGWHTGVHTDYTTAFGLHSSDFTQPASMSDLATLIETQLANANHISVYATGYGPDGIHDVHRKLTGSDGVIVIDPLSKPAHMIMFRFSTDTF